MLGIEHSQQQLFSYVNLEERIPVNHARKGNAVPDDIRQGEGYAISLKIRKRIEEVFGWMKTVGGMRKLKLIGREKVSGQFRFVAAIYNLVRIGSLTGWWAGSHTEGQYALNPHKTCG